MLGTRTIRLTVVALRLLTAPVSAWAEFHCTSGEAVIDERNNSGVVVSAAHAGLCLVKYNDGHTQAWVAGNLLRSAVPTASQDLPPASEQTASIRGVAVLRPAPVTNQVVYRADALGHVILSSEVDGVPVRFLVDTGATLVSLSLEDAAAVGFKRRELTFDQAVQTANGPTHAALVSLREIRLGELEVNDVSASVIEGLKHSVLGMSFLSRVKSFTMRDGALTIDW